MKVSPTAIGLFILGAIALGIVALVTLGGARFFQGHVMAVAYFEGNVHGLSPGAHVEFRGVPVGRVSAVRLEVDLRDQSAVIPVIMEIDPHSWAYVGGGPHPPLTIPEAVARGLRAELQMQSFVTGQMLLELDLRPDTPARLFRPNTTGYPEIPTVQSDIERLKDVISGLPLREIANSLNSAVRDLDRLLAAPELPDLLKNLAAAAANTNTLMAGLNGDRAKLMAQLQTTLDSFDKVAKSLQGLSGDARKTVKNLDRMSTTELRKALKTADASLDQMQRAFSEVADMLSPNSPERTRLSRILDTLSNTMQSLRNFAGELRRKPNALIFGN